MRAQSSVSRDSRASWSPDLYPDRGRISSRPGRQMPATKDENRSSFAINWPAHGLPIEGRWYTSIFRNALDRSSIRTASVYRDLQDLRQISHLGRRQRRFSRREYFIRYAGWPSILCLGHRRDKDQKNQHSSAPARPTLERGLKATQDLHRLFRSVRAGSEHHRRGDV